jgi:hypothetical protein
MVTGPGWSVAASAETAHAAADEPADVVCAAVKEEPAPVPVAVVEVLPQATSAHATATDGNKIQSVEWSVRRRIPFLLSSSRLGAMTSSSYPLAMMCQGQVEYTLMVNVPPAE